MKDIIPRLIASAIAGIGASVVIVAVLAMIGFGLLALHGFVQAQFSEPWQRFVVLTVPVALVATAWIFLRLGREG